ncbi:MAG: glycosyltransferase family 2 protein [Eubacteriales bacterium]
MYKGKKIGVVVPAYNERELISGVINTIPSFVDRIYAVNDASTDDTLEILNNLAASNKKLFVINHLVNGGVGKAILSGHKAALKEGIDVIAVMAGDGQMEPEVLPNILDPVVDGIADYAKGNRLASLQDRKQMSAWRTFGNFLLTYLNKIASGYWHIVDPQNGYTAISSKMLTQLNLDKIETGFPFENDILVKLNVLGARVVDVPHKAKYGKEQSKIKYKKFIINTSWVLLKDFFWRINAKYINKYQ